MSFTANPRAPQPHPNDVPQEATGPVTSDSLAAESLQSGGGFAENKNVNAVGSDDNDPTLKTTDTSGISTLRPAPSGTTRIEEDESGAGRDEKGPGGLKYSEAPGEPELHGIHSDQGHVGGTKNTSQQQDQSGASGDTFTDSKVPSGGYGQTPDPKIHSSGSAEPSSTSASSSGPAQSSSSSTTTGIRPHVDQAPTYAARVAGTVRGEGELKPKGENLTEGDVPQTKTFTGDVGGPHDPGRLAEQKFDTANSAAAGGVGEQQTQLEEGTGQYDVLQSERA